MINTIIQDILKTTQNASSTDKFDVNQFCYGMLLIYRNFQMDVDMDILAIKKKLQDTTLLELQDIQRRSIRSSSFSSPKVNQSETSSNDNIYTSSHRRKQINVEKLSYSDKEQKLRLYALYRDTLKINNNSNLQVNPTKNPFSSHSQHIKLILEYLIVYMYSQCSTSTLDTKINTLERQLFLIKDSKRNNYNWATALSQMNNPTGINPLEEKARLMLQQRMKTLGIETPDDQNAIKKAIEQCKERYPAPTSTISLSHILNPTSNSSMYQFFMTTWLNHSVEPNSNFKLYLNKFASVSPLHKETLYNQSLSFGIDKEWLNSPIIPFQSQLQNNHLFDKINSSPAKSIKTESSNSSSATSLTPVPVIPVVIPTTPPSSRKAPPPPPSRKKDPTSIAKQKHVSSPVTAIPIAPSPPPPPVNYMPPSPPQTDIKSPADIPTPPSRPVIKQTPNQALPTSLLDQIKNVSKTSLNAVDSTTSLESVQPEVQVNPMMAQLQQSINNRRSAISSSSDEEWSPQKDPEPLEQVKQYNSPLQVTPVQAIEQPVDPIQDNVFVDPEEYYNLSNPFEMVDPIDIPIDNFVSNQSPLSASQMVIALYDYHGIEGDLSFTQGDLITVVSVEQDWMTGVLNNVQGTFPSNYVEPYKVGLTKAKCVFDFTAIEATDLSIRVDEIFYIIDYIEGNGWHNACKLDHSEVGQVPDHYFTLQVATSINKTPTTLSQQSQSVLDEFIVTEQTYIRDLEMVISIFVLPLDELKIISLQDIQSIFNNLVQLLDIHKEYIEQIKVDFTKINQFIHGLSIYKDYCAFQYESQQLLKGLMSNPKFSSFIHKQEQLPSCRQMQLSTYLLLPMQRITRLNLLMKQFTKYLTKNDHHYKEYMDSQLFLDQLLKEINEEAKKKESHFRIALLQQKLDFGDLELKYHFDITMHTKLEEQRIWVHDGILIKVKSKKRLSGFLFNDMLLLTTTEGNKYKVYRRPLRLAELVVVHKLQDEEQVIRLTTPDEELIVKAEHSSSYKLWVNLIKQSIVAYKEKEKHFFENERVNTDKLQHLLGTQVHTSDFIGTIQVTIENGTNMPQLELKKYFVVCQVADQKLKSKIVKSTLKPKFNQMLLFSLKSMEEIIKIYLYNQTKYGEDVMVGFHEMPLNFLEYYGEKETELMVINVGSEATLSIKLKFKSAS